MTDPNRRVSLRSVAMPAEHGGWGLTLEPSILGVLVAPSLAGLLLGLAAVLVFVARTPLRLLLIGRHHQDRRRSAQSRRRTDLATRVGAIELVAAGIAVLMAAVLAADPMWWLPAAVATPLFVVALWFDMRSLSRHLIPEVAGSVALASVASMSALAGGASMTLALGLWLILGARILSSIPHVRAQVRRLHGRSAAVMPMLIGDLAALIVAAVAVWLDTSLILGAAAIVGLIVVQRITLARPARPAKVLGVRQMVLGFTVVGLTALGVWLL
jgi:hypothetical protein